MIQQHGRTLRSAPRVAIGQSRASCGAQQVKASDLYGMDIESLTTRYSLVCHETRTKVMVGGDGDSADEMLSALGTDDARAALCAFLMRNRAFPLHLVSESWTGESDYAAYESFSSEEE